MEIPFRISKDNRKRPALFKCVSCAHEGNGDAAAAINIKERGQSSLACGESEKKAQVNSARSEKPATNQQHEPTEVISGASCSQSRICLVDGEETSIMLERTAPPFDFRESKDLWSDSGRRPVADHGPRSVLSVKSPRNGSLVSTLLASHRAPRMEGTPGRRINRTRNLT